ncbi:helix-turn-helix domain-containing protein [Microbacterium sp. Yaish 1]|uniref:helix-turn-helix domain-containing protein n=1 Tax=Microbacterium sp. Yaish 1 TaxID=2025014 RepID=UPI000B93C649|nr:XRE family transcriptional regulator [Microbacterium sp. Yaish 1]OYC97222.1 hypothetical protein CI089_01320 [Microbacterium sp. Yaish 1]
MDEPVIGRIRQIIEESGETQQKVAEKIGIDASKLTKSLSGTRRFTSLELALLAQLGRRTVDWVLTGRPSRSWSFAHRLSAVAPEVANKAGEGAVRAIAEFHENLDALGFLPERRADRPTLAHPQSYVRSGNELAKWALRHMPRPMVGTSNATLIADIEDTFGIDVVTTELPDGCDGMSYADGDLRLIVLASTDGAARQRYTLAHELGHILAGDAEESVIRENLGQGERNLAERRADVFAASFLAPAEEVTTALAKQEANAQETLAFELGVSPVSLSWRLKNLGFVTESERRQLASLSSRDVARLLDRSAEQLERDRLSQQERPPMRLLRGQLNAFHAGQATLHPVAALLNLDLDTTYRIFASTPSESPAGNPESSD